MIKRFKIVFLVINVLLFSVVVSDIYGITKVNVNSTQAKIGENVDVKIDIIDNS